MTYIVLQAGTRNHWSWATRRAAKKGISMTGFKSWLAWRSAYLTQPLGQPRATACYVMMNWTMALLSAATSAASRRLFWRTCGQVLMWLLYGGDVCV